MFERPATAGGGLSSLATVNLPVFFYKTELAKEVVRQDI